MGTAAQLAEERRWATVLFADLSGFTHLAAQMDPEDVHAIVASSMERMGQIVEHFGGSVLRVIGDELMALFGAPVAHEDDAARAVRTALALHQYVGEKSEEFAGLSLHIGINTGEMIFGPVGPDRGFTVIGDAVNVAARLVATAPSGGTLVGEETYLATRRTITYRPVERLRVKGKDEPVAAYGPLAVRPAVGERVFSARPMVGRNDQLALLRDRWDDVVADRRAHLVTVAGPAGIGKSRLVREFSASLRACRPRSVLGRSLPYGENTGYGAFAQQLKAIAGILDTDTSPAAAAKLARVVAELLPSAQAEVVTSHLSLMIGLGTEGVETDKEALLLSAQLFIEALARQQPTVLVFEDLHWADPSLLDLVEFIVDRVQRAPVLVLAVARSNLFEIRPHWARGLGHSTLVTLSELPRSECETLAAALVPAFAGSSVVSSLVDKSGGNPLFLEELAASLTERATELVTGLPSTVKGIIAARIDALPPTERHALLSASVIGKVFWRGTLEALGVEGELDAVLEALEARDLIHRQPTSQFENDVEYVFKHILIREVAYATVLRATRRAHHGAVARFIETAVGDRQGESASLLAHHWREAGQPEPAVGYLMVAAQTAARAFAYQEAIALLRSALELLPDVPEPGRDERELEVLLAMVAPLMRTRGYASSEVGEVLERAQRLCGTMHRGGALLASLWGLYAFALVRADFARAQEFADHFQRLSRDSPDPLFGLASDQAAMVVAFHVGEPRQARRHAQQAVLRADSLDDGSLSDVFAGQHPSVFSRGFWALADWLLGEEHQAAERSEEAMLIAGRLDQPFTVAFSLFFDAWLAVFRRDVPRVLRRSEEALTICREREFALFGAMSSMLHGWGRAHSAEATAGIAELRQGLGAMEATGANMLRPFFLALLADGYAQAAELDEGLAVIEEALAVGDRTGERFYEAELYRLRAELLWARSSGATDEVDGALRQALAVAREQQAKGLEMLAQATRARLDRQGGAAWRLR